MWFDNNGVGGLVQARQKVKLAGGRTYKVYYWAKLRGRYDTWGAYEYYTPTGQYMFVNRPSLESQLKSEQWVQLSFEVQLGDVRDNDVWIYIRGGGTVGQFNSWLFIDDVSLDTSGPVSGYINYTGARAKGSVNCWELSGGSGHLIKTFRNNEILNARDLESTQFPNTTWIMTDGGGWWGYSRRSDIDVSYCSNNSIHQMFGDDVIKIGSSGIHVAHLQHYLNRYLPDSYALTVDGVFGDKDSKTRQALMDFQNWHPDLTRDGEAGDKTKQALMDYVLSLD